MIFLLRTSGQLIQKVARLGLKAPPIDFQSNLTSPPKKKATRQDPKTTQLVPKGDSTESQGAPMITRQPNRSRQSDSASFKRRPAGTQAHLQDPPRHQLHSVPSSASKPLSSKTLQQKTLQNDCSVLYKLFPFRLCHSTVPWTWQRRV